MAKVGSIDEYNNWLDYKRRGGELFIDLWRDAGSPPNPDLEGKMPEPEPTTLIGTMGEVKAGTVVPEELVSTPEETDTTPEDTETPTPTSDALSTSDFATLLGGDYTSADIRKMIADGIIEGGKGDNNRWVIDSGQAEGLLDALDEAAANKGMGTTEFAQNLGGEYTSDDVRGWIADGLLDAEKIGGRWEIADINIDQFLEGLEGDVVAPDNVEVPSGSGTATWGTGDFASEWGEDYDIQDVYDLIADGLIEAEKVGGRWVIEPGQLEGLDDRISDFDLSQPLSTGGFAALLGDEYTSADVRKMIKDEVIIGEMGDNGFWVIDRGQLEGLQDRLDEGGMPDDISEDVESAEELESAKDWLSTSEAAEMFGLSTSAVRSLIDNTTVSAEKVGNRWQISAPSLYSYMNVRGGQGVVVERVKNAWPGTAATGETLDLNSAKVRSLITSGDLKATKIGSAWYIDPTSVEAYQKVLEDQPLTTERLAALWGEDYTSDDIETLIQFGSIDAELVDGEYQIDKGQDKLKGLLGYVKPQAPLPPEEWLDPADEEAPSPSSEYDLTDTPDTGATAPTAELPEVSVTPVVGVEPDDILEDEESAEEPETISEINIVDALAELNSGDFSSLLTASWDEMVDFSAIYGIELIQKSIPVTGAKAMIVGNTLTIDPTAAPYTKKVARDIVHELGHIVYRSLDVSAQEDWATAKVAAEGVSKWEESGLPWASTVDVNSEYFADMFSTFALGTEIDSVVSTALDTAFDTLTVQDAVEVEQELVQQETGGLDISVAPDSYTMPDIESLVGGIADGTLPVISVLPPATYPSAYPMPIISPTAEKGKRPIQETVPGIDLSVPVDSYEMPDIVSLADGSIPVQSILPPANYSHPLPILMELPSIPEVKPEAPVSVGAEVDYRKDSRRDTYEVRGARTTEYGVQDKPQVESTVTPKEPAIAKKIARLKQPGDRGYVKSGEPAADSMVISATRRRTLSQKRRLARLQESFPDIDWR